MRKKWLLKVPNSAINNARTISSAKSPLKLASRDQHVDLTDSVAESTSLLIGVPAVALAAVALAAVALTAASATVLGERLDRDEIDRSLPVLRSRPGQNLQRKLDSEDGELISVLVSSRDDVAIADRLLHRRDIVEPDDQNLAPPASRSNA
jgi:hypothetical protein